MMIRVDKDLSASIVCQSDAKTLILCIEHPRSKFDEIRAKLDEVIKFESKNKAFINQDNILMINNGRYIENYNLLMQNLWKQDHLNELNGDITLDVYWNCKLDNVILKDVYKISINNGHYYSNKSDETLLTAAINSNLKEIPSGCRNGGCGICLLKILDGSYMCKEMSEKKIDRNNQCYLSCKVYPLSDLIVEIPKRKISSSH
ncbi:hypothetical protein B9X71_07155 [Acinetobacter baumannii]|uniref:2Fe-2S iron-sulfur cluster-binding protein n=1 Tax=Acinetobacter baumannii TaxID=470 RepID=UPI000A354BC3|nr:2Fe-2S iron-sulfur cluster binding domain-containing protein [Acinetobacter baumannii]MCR6568355.1 2Fe-2S iron-sulfur cluster binding domain-containing protein [Acinetobacter baumannii]MCT9165208.1 2Fe-2S iron-sulfur cluster binding domain-containing protein [Acinetobacter baumannii]MCT9171843.1 2Fe-2S iron-sulfur cluster binding domain-containing protein [Acinetobacter baumannii]MCT9179550.1 2Fe-2S iron-sulfur cluster binding domain-containing protein [Acinetobacter baumannii]MDV4322247.1 